MVGVNRFTVSEPSPLTTGDGLIMQADPTAEADQCARLAQWRSDRDPEAVANALAALKEAARTGANIMPACIHCAKAGATTGETPLVVGGIIPDDDARTLQAMGVAKVYTPKDFQLNRIMLDLVALADPAPVAAE